MRHRHCTTLGTDDDDDDRIPEAIDQLWKHLKAAERRCERAAQLANDLGRVLRQETGARFAELSSRAYKIRDIARGDYPEKTVE